MDHRIAALLNAEAYRTGASDDAIISLLDSVGGPLPADLLGFYRSTDGYDGEIGEHGYIHLWSVKDIVRMNAAYSVGDYAPGLVLFGGNGANTAYGVDTTERSRNDGPYVETDFVGLGPDAIFHRCHTLAELLQHAAEV